MEGYPCRKCKKEDLVQQTTITNQPKLLILHINRFSH
jgi:ubiquitin C-terminal hydrolase